MYRLQRRSFWYRGKVKLTHEVNDEVFTQRLRWCLAAYWFQSTSIANALLPNLWLWKTSDTCLRTHICLWSSLFKKRDLRICLNWSYMGMCVMVAILGSPLLTLSDLFFKVERSWKFEERWTAFLFKSVMVMAVYAPNCNKEFDGHERFKKKAPMSYETDVELGPKNFDITGDFNVEPGLLCTDEDDNEELSEMYKPPCWQGWGNDQSGFKKMLCCGIMKEFNCKVMWKRRKKKAQLDYILVPRRKADKAYIHSDVKTWHSWDDYPITLLYRKMIRRIISLRRKEERNRRDG